MNSKAEYTKLHNELTECYYKYWQLGNSKPWHGYDVQGTAEESHTLFYKLHAILWHKLILKLSETDATLLVKETYIDSEHYNKSQVDRATDYIAERTKESITLDVIK